MSNGDSFDWSGSGNEAFGGVDPFAYAPIPALDVPSNYDDPFFDDEFFSTKDPDPRYDPAASFFDFEPGFDDPFFFDSNSSVTDTPTLMGDDSGLLQTLGNTLPRWFASTLANQQKPFAYGPTYNPQYAKRSTNPLPSTSNIRPAGFLTGTQIGDGLIIGGLVIVAIALAWGFRKS